ncbi:hypothetical protein OPKNFCMD_5366 [Methylobacterium crusticola]|uniref:Uncharacterized protein n=1 Tax=Methylobacterium crusticola TaxID=1697972 RepID=A0ABQ4R6Q1_9HYPH|nr:hypothetical protein [Methylobacterium crusticola]GJD52600.1 hypothetical protein OPKNFCMD_5366 [Methylobacterium crusticola]
MVSIGAALDAATSIFGSSLFVGRMRGGAPAPAAGEAGPAPQPEAASDPEDVAALFRAIEAGLRDAGYLTD